MIQFNELYTSLPEKDEHKKSKEYKKLSPKMKDAVDEIFAKMDAKPSDFLNTFEKTINQISKYIGCQKNNLWDILKKKCYQFKE